MVWSPFPSQYILIYRRVHDSVHRLPASRSQIGGPTRQSREALCAFNPHNKDPPIECGLVKATLTRRPGTYLHRSPQWWKAIPVSLQYVGVLLGCLRWIWRPVLWMLAGAHIHFSLLSPSLLVLWPRQCMIT